MFDTIVWACDGRAEDRRDLAFVRRLCQSRRCRLWIVHVARATAASDPPFALAGGADPAIEWLKTQTRQLRADGIDASLHVVRDVLGAPVAAIVQLVRDVDADLLVVGGHRRERQRRARPGATALGLLATAGCAALWLGAQLGDAPDPSPPAPRC